MPGVVAFGAMQAMGHTHGGGGVPPIVWGFILLFFGLMFAALGAISVEAALDRDDSIVSRIIMWGLTAMCGVSALALVVLSILVWCGV